MRRNTVPRSISWNAGAARSGADGGFPVADGQAFVYNARALRMAQ